MRSDIIAIVGGGRRADKRVEVRIRELATGRVQLHFQENAQAASGAVWLSFSLEQVSELIRQLQSSRDRCFEQAKAADREARQLEELHRELDQVEKKQAERCTVVHEDRRCTRTSFHSGDHWLEALR